MGAKYWIKLYHEILNDPKMGRLSDRLFRRTIELFLVAGEYDENGLLPSIRDIAWRLRIDEEQLETEMIELQRVGILSVQDSMWLVTKFAERQAPMDKAEYMRRSREEDQRRKYYQPRYQPVTGSNAESDTDTDKESDTEEEAIGAVYQLYESAIGVLDGHASDVMDGLIDEYGTEKVTDAILVAERNGGRHINYIAAVLKNPRKDKSTTRLTADEMLAILEANKPDGDE